MSLFDEKFSELKEHLRKASEAALMMGHILNEDADPIQMEKGKLFIKVGRMLEQAYNMALHIMSGRLH